MVRAGVFTRLGRLAVAKPKVVLGAAAVFFVLAGLAGGSVARHLSTGGLDDTGSQATRAAAILNRVFHQGSPDVALLVRARHGTVDDPAVAAAGTALTSELAAQPGVEQATSYWSLARVPPLRSKDGTTALVFGRVPGNQNHQNDVLTYGASVARAPHRLLARRQRSLAVAHFHEPQIDCQALHRHRGNLFHPRRSRGGDDATSALATRESIHRS